MTMSTATAITRWVLVVTFGVTCAASLASRQVRDAAGVAPAGAAEISGTVVTSDADAAPVRRATIRLSSTTLGSSLLTTVTDDEGRFAFTRVPAGRYSLSAAKGGYLPAAYGSTRPGGAATPVTVGEGQHVSGLTMRLLKGSVITGTVRDERGRPVPDVTVSVLHETWDSGERALGPPEFGARQITDDRGSYRLYGLAPGQYVVSATWPARSDPSTARNDIHQITGADVQRAQQLLRGASGPGAVSTVGAAPPPVTVAYVPAYYPSALTQADAVTITLGPHDERSGIDVQLRMAHPASIGGVTTGPDGAPMARVKVNVIDTGPTSMPGMAHPVVASTISGRDGEFVIFGIAPGRYVVEGWAYASREGAPVSGRPPASITGTADVVVDGVDITTSIRLSPLGHVSGRIVFDGTTAPPDVTGVPLLLGQVPPMVTRSGSPGPDGTFVFTDVPPGAYRLTLRQYSPVGWMGWMLKSAMVGGVDVSDRPFEITSNQNVENVVITFTDHHTELFGTLRNAAGQPAPDYVLIVYSADPRFWVAQTRRTRQVRPGTDGTFIVRDLPPGEYFISALADVADGRWNDPAFLAELASHRPIKVALADGEQRVQDIRVGGAG